MSARIATARASVALVLLFACVACGERSRPAAPKPPVQSFVSRPDLRPPPVHVVVPAHDTAPGYVFLAPKKEVEQAAR